MEASNSIRLMHAEARSSGASTIALVLPLVAMAGRAQAFCPTSAVSRRLTVAPSAAVWAVVLVNIVSFCALGAAAGDLASAIVGARAVAASALVALQALCSLLGRLLRSLWVNSRHIF